MNAFANHFSFEFFTGLRNKNLLLFNYLFPLGFYTLMGLVMTSINPFFTETMLPAMLVFIVLAGAVLGLPAPLVEYREAGILRSFKINGVPAASVLSIPALTTCFHLLITGTVITATAAPCFKTPLPVNWPAFILAYLVLLLACSGLGLLIGVVSANTQATVLWSQLIFLPSMILSGMMVPAELLPAPLQKASLLLPGTHAMQAFKGLAMGLETTYAPWWQVIILLAGGMAAFGLALFLFSWDSRNNSRRGHPALALLALLPYLAGMLLL